ncbi:MAG: FmdB family zinc ribbon protein [Bryobacteraceae bacterium]
MPLYEYLCHRCGKSFEVLQKFADEPLTQHPECGGEVERLVSAPTLQFKGSGWYINDYGSGKASAPDSKNGQAKTGGKPESKPETKSENTSAPAASADK